MSFTLGSVSGASQGGTLTELLALGAADVFLTACPSITFWRFRYNKHTNFAMESIEQEFNNNPAFGNSCQATLNRNGDLVYYVYAVFDIPGICGVESTGVSQFPACDPCDPCGDNATIGPQPDPCAAGVSLQPSDFENDFLLGSAGTVDACTGLARPWAHWVNAVGQYLIKTCALTIGNQLIDTLYADYLFMWEELAGKPGKRLHEMIGKRYTRAMLVEDSKWDRRLYVPLPFFFTQTSGNALSMVSLQFHGINIVMQFESLTNLIQVSDSNVAVIKTRDQQPITSQDMRARLDVTYIYLDQEERDRFAAGTFEQLISQVQGYTQQISTLQARLQLHFNHPVIELIFAVRRQKNETCNNWSNFSGVWGRDPIKSVQLLLNNQPKFAPREGRYFRLVQPYQHHTNIPDAFVYSYSFALHPEEPQPSGSCNFSRIDNSVFVLQLQEQLQGENCTALVFARNWNVFRFKEGLGGLSFGS